MNTISTDPTKVTTTASEEKRQREQAAKAAPKFMADMSHRVGHLSERVSSIDLIDTVDRQIELAVAPLLTMKANLLGDRDFMLSDETLCYLAGNIQLCVADIHATIMEFMRITEEKSNFMAIVSQSTEAADTLLEKISIYYGDNRDFNLPNKAIVAMLDDVLIELRKLRTAVDVFYELGK